jgi:guanylate kinase
MEQKLMQTGRLIVLTGPSGVGKGTLVELLTQAHPELYLSVSATTRSPRVGEVEGRDYFFKTRSEFETMIKNGELLEWAEYAGNYYGTPLSTVEAKIAEGKQVLLEIEVIGARQIQRSFPNALRIFILPPSVAELEKRLRGRGTDDPSAIALRLAQAKLELETAGEFDYQVVNDDLKTALKEIETILESSS